MKRLLLLMCCLFAGITVLASAGTDDLQGIRAAMVRAVRSSPVTDSLYVRLKAKNSADALLTGYLGTLEALKAKHSWNPYNKLRFVAASRKTMQLAVDKDPRNAEIRFMRFSIQHYTPAFLGYSANLEEDRKILYELFRDRKFGRVDPGMIKSMAKFMISSGRCSAAEASIFKKFT